MKKSTKILIITISTILIALAVMVTVFAQTNNINSLAEAKAYFQSIFDAESKEILNELSDESFDDILAEIKDIEHSNNADSDALSYYHIALAEKMSTADKDDITSAILDTELSAESRTTIIISAQANEIALDYERLSAAIADDKYEDIRSMLIDVVADATPDNIEEIEEIVNNRSEGFSAAIDALRKIKPSKAIAVADEILADYSGEYDEIFRGAFSVKAYQAMLDPTDANCAEFIALCDRILNTPCNNAEGRETYIISYLEEIQNKQILIYCREKGIDELMCGHNLASTLAKVLKEPASVENIDLFIHFYPGIISQSIWEAVNEHLANNKEFYNSNPELKEKLENISAENYETMSILSEPNEPREVE